MGRSSVGAKLGIWQNVWCGLPLALYYYSAKLWYNSPLSFVMLTLECFHGINLIFSALYCKNLAQLSHLLFMLPREHCFSGKPRLADFFVDIILHWSLSWASLPDRLKLSPDSPWHSPIKKSSGVLSVSLYHHTLLHCFTQFALYLRSGIHTHTSSVHSSRNDHLSDTPSPVSTPAQFTLLETTIYLIHPVRYPHQLNSLF